MHADLHVFLLVPISKAVLLLTNALSSLLVTQHFKKMKIEVLETLRHLAHAPGVHFQEWGPQLHAA
jgi:hypothetical protein